MVHFENTISSQIRRKIGFRIVIFITILSCVLAAFTAYDTEKIYNNLSKNLNGIANQLSAFIVSQSVIYNQLSIPLKITEISKEAGVKILWDKSMVTNTKTTLSWQPLVHWKYTYPIYGIDGHNFGVLKIYGSLLSHSKILSDFFVRGVFLILSIVAAIFLLYPLTKTIPNEIFVSPIADLLKLLKSNVTLDENQEILYQKYPIEITEIKENILSLLQSVKLVSQQATIAKISAQVAHDIQSPLTALGILLRDLSVFPENRRILIRDAVTRIRDIANNLFPQRIYAEDAKADCLLTSVIDSIVSEKRIQYKGNLNIQIKFESTKNSYGLFSQINLVEFKRLLSNLINNAVESIPNQGEVLITLDQKKDKAILSIKDTGIGIPKIVLERLGTEGNTFNKKGGSGLGLAHAIRVVKTWDGLLEIVETSSLGTTITISLPLSTPPSWLLPELLIKGDMQILVLDDDHAIHHVWDDRFQSVTCVDKKINIIHFGNQNALFNWLSEHTQQDNFLLLCDYEILGESQNGLDIIETLNPNFQCILVTSHYEKIEIQLRCKKLGISLLPKSLATMVPIRITG